MASLINKKNTSAGFGNNYKKADAFMNLEVKTSNGNKKIGAIPLHLEKAIHALLIDNADNVEKISFSIDIHVVEQEDDLALDLGEELDPTTEALKKEFADA
jgi:hypothetical protein